MHQRIAVEAQGKNGEKQRRTAVPARGTTLYPT